MKTSSLHTPESQPTLCPLIRTASLFLATVCLGLCAPAALNAQINHVWDGGGANDYLATAGNWSGEAVPVAGDTLIWNGLEAGEIGAVVTGDLFGNSTSGLAGITITSGQTAALTITSTSGTRTLRMARDGNFTIQSGAGAVTLGGTNAWGFTIAGSGTSDFTFTNSSANTATIGSVVSISRGGSTGTRGLIFNGAGSWDVGATVSTNIASLNKSGAGVLTYSGTTGATALGGGVSVTEGKLVITGTLSYASGPVSVASGATLAGTGTINGATTLAGGSFLSAGVDDSTLGTLTFASALGATSGVTVSLNLNSANGTHDQLVAAGVTLGNATLSLTDLGGAVLAEGATFTLVNNISAGSVSGTFAGLAEGATITTGLNTYVISYLGGTGNDITLTVITGGLPGPSAAIIDVRAAPYLAKGDGVSDDRAAFASALAALNSGDVLFVPAGTYRIVLTGTVLSLKPGATLLGEGSDTVLKLENGGSTSGREFIRPGGSNVTVDGITVERAANFPLVVFNLRHSSAPFGITIRNSTIIGNRDLYATYCHGFQIGGSNATEILLDNLTVTTCSYGLFQASTDTGSVTGVAVFNSQFYANYSSDLEFNAPNGTLSDVLVKDCHFRDNRATGSSSGWAVGFANITNGRIEDCFIKNYGRAGIHVEDRSKDIVISGNTITGTATLGDNPIFIVSGATSANVTDGVILTRNLIDGRGNTRGAYLLLVTGGGSGYPTPINVLVTDNILINSNTTSTWYLQSGSGPTPTANIIYDPTP